MRLVLTAIGLVLLVGGVAVTLRHQSYGRFQQDTEDAYVRADFVTVSPRISGTIARVMVSDNQTVRRGQPLVAIDAAAFDAAVAGAEAQLRVAAAVRGAAQAAVAEQAAGLLQQAAQVRLAEADLAYARQEAARLAPLAASGAEPRTRYDEAVHSLRRAQAARDSQAAALNAQRRRSASLRAQVDQAEAQSGVYRAQSAAAQVDVDATVLRASVDGRIGDLTVQVGQSVQPGVRLMSIVPVQALYVEANFKETQMGLVRPGQPVRIHVDALPQAEMHGVVESVSPGTGAQFALIPPQNATGNFTKVVQRVPVRIRLDAGPEARRILVPGLSVQATIDTRSARGAQARLRREAQANAR